MDTSGLIAVHADTWQVATRHQFLEGMRTGDLPNAALDRWLVQDYHYVDRLLRFQALLLAAAPRTDQLVLAGGLAALAEELGWFEQLAAVRELDLAAPLHPACRNYTDYLLTLGYRCLTATGADADLAYTPAITAVWAVERAYLDAWLSARPGAGAFSDLVSHWTTDEFREYVAGLALAADRALAESSLGACREAEQAFLAIAAYEREFWQMAFAASG